jgi:hypothetical protein
VCHFLSAVSDLLRSHAQAENRAVIRDMFFWKCVQESHPIWTQAVSHFSKQCKSCVCHSPWLCSLRWRSWPCGCWDCGFKSRFVRGCLFLVSICCIVSRRGLARTRLLIPGVLQCVSEMNVWSRRGLALTVIDAKL